MGNRKQAIALALLAATGTMGAVATQAQQNHITPMVRNYEKEGEITEVSENGITLSGTAGPDGAMINYSIDSETAGITSKADITSVTWTNGSDTIDAADVNYTFDDETGLIGKVQFMNFDSEADLDIVGTIESPDVEAPTRKQTTTPHLKFKTLQNATVNITKTTPTTTGALYEAIFIIAQSDVTDWHPTIKDVSVVDAAGAVVESNIADLLTEGNPTTNKKFEVTGLNPGETKTLSVKYTYQAREGATIKSTTVSLGELTALNDAKPVENVQATVPEETITQTTAVINGTFDIPQDEGYKPTQVSDVFVVANGDEQPQINNITHNENGAAGTFSADISGLTAGTDYTFAVTVMDLGGTGSGTEVSFKTKELEAAPEPTLTSAKVKDGTLTQTSATIEFDIKTPLATPTTDGTTVQEVEINEQTSKDLTIGDGNVTGTVDLTNLEPGKEVTFDINVKYNNLKQPKKIGDVSVKADDLTEANPITIITTDPTTITTNKETLVTWMVDKPSVGENQKASELDSVVISGEGIDGGTYEATTDELGKFAGTFKVNAAYGSNGQITVTAKDKIETTISTTIDVNVPEQAQNNITSISIDNPAQITEATSTTINYSVEAESNDDGKTAVVDKVELIKTTDGADTVVATNTENELTGSFTYEPVVGEVSTLSLKVYGSGTKESGLASSNSIDVNVKKNAAIEPTLKITAEAINQVSANINYDLTIPTGDTTTEDTKVDSIVITGDNDFSETTLTDITSGNGKTQKVEGLKAGTKYNLTATVTWSGVEDTTTNTQTEAFTLETNSKLASKEPEATAVTKGPSQTSVTVDTTYTDVEGDDTHFGSTFVSAELSGEDIDTPINIENNTATVIGLTAGKEYSDWKVTFKYNNGIDVQSFDKEIAKFKTLDKLDADAPTITVDEVITTQHTATFKVDVKEFEPSDPESQNSSKVTGITLSGTDTDGVTIGNTGGEVTVNGLKEETTYSDWKLTTTWEGSSSATPVETTIKTFTTSGLVGAKPITDLKIDTTTPTYNGGAISGSFAIPTNDENTQETVVNEVIVKASVGGQDISSVKTNWNKGETNFSAEITGVEPEKEVSVTVTVKGNWTEDVTSTATFTTSKLESAKPITDLSIKQDSVTYNSAKVSGSFKTPDHIDGIEDTKVDNVEVTTTEGLVEASWTEGEEIFFADITGLTVGQTATVTVTVTGNFTTQTANVDVTAGELADANPIAAEDITLTPDAEITTKGEQTIDYKIKLPVEEEGIEKTTITNIEVLKNGEVDTSITIDNKTAPEGTFKFMSEAGDNYSYTLRVTTNAPSNTVTSTDSVVVNVEKDYDTGSITEPSVVDGTITDTTADVLFNANLNPNGDEFNADKMTVSAEGYLVEAQDVIQGDNIIHLTNLPVNKETIVTLTFTHASGAAATTKEVTIKTTSSGLDTGTIGPVTVIIGSPKPTSARIQFEANLNPNAETHEPDAMTVSAGEYLEETEVKDEHNELSLTNLPVNTETIVTLTFTHANGDEETKDVTVKTPDLPFQFKAQIDTIINEGDTNSILFTISSTQTPEATAELTVEAKVNDEKTTLDVEKVESYSKDGINDQYKIKNIVPTSVYKDIRVKYGDSYANLTDANGNEIDNITGGVVTPKPDKPVGIPEATSPWTTAVIIEIIVGTLLLVTIPLVVLLIMKKKNS